MKTEKKHRKNQQGVALIFAIGILSLLMFLGLAFVTNAVLTQKIAYNNASRSQGKLLAQTAVNRLTAHIMHHQLSELRNSGSSTGVDYTQVFSLAGSTNGGAACDDFIQAGASSSLLTYTDGSQTYLCNSPARWQFIENDAGELTGRFAYWVLPDLNSGSLDLNQVAKGGYRYAGNAANPTPREYRLGKDISELNIDLPNSFFRNAAQPNALQPAAADQTTYDWNTQPLLVSDLESYFNIAFDGTGQNRDDALLWLRNWFAETGNVRNDLEVYYFQSGSGLEAMSRFDLSRNDWDTGLGLGAASNNSDAMVQALMMLSGTGNDPDISANLRFNSSESRSIPEVGLPFLKRIGTSSESTFSNLLDLRKQIAANLIDYCDNDDVPTSDIPALNWTVNSTPAYTGNEKTPYINEVAVGGAITVEETAPTGTLYKAALKVTLKPEVIAEIINIYEAQTGAAQFQTQLNNLSVQLTINTTWEVTYQITLPIFGTITRTETLTPTLQNIPITLSSTTPSDVVIDIPELAAHTNGYRIAGKELGALSTVQNYTFLLSGATLGTVTKATLKTISIRVTEATASFAGMILKNAAGGTLNNVDFVRPSLELEADTDGPYLLNIDPTATGRVNCPLTTEAKTQYNRFYLVGLEAKDPRQNLNSGDWKVDAKLCGYNLTDWSSFNVDPAAATLTARLTGGSRNSDSNPSNKVYQDPADVTSAVVGDAETVTDPAWQSATQHLSTAYIANEPMKSLWELGAIHRGVAWQTINLKKAPSGLSLSTLHNISTSPTAAGSSYADGDGVILDQVKLVDNGANFSSGKIDLNKIPASNTGWDGRFIDSVFAGVYLGNTYADLHNAYAARTPVGGGISTTDAAAITTSLYSTKTSTWESRAELLAYTGANGYFNGFGHLTDDMNNTDAAQEEFVGKTINLLKTQMASQQPESDTLRAVVVAQTIKDIGGESGPVPITRFRPSDGDPETQNCEIGTYEAPVADGNGYVYFDEITSEVKLLVTLQRNWEQTDPNRKTYSMKVMQMEYID